MDQKAANRWVARFIPLILIGIVGYATWVVVVLVCVDYLIKPSSSIHRPRPGAAIAILVIYFILFFLVSFPYFRILYTIATNPGFIRRGLQYHKEKAGSSRRLTGGNRKRPVSESSEEEKVHGRSRNLIGGNGYPRSQAYQEGLIPIGRPTRDTDAPGLEEFYTKDVFVCEDDGRPIWCSKCLNWKPDRTHHCREVDRCVRKMDHFCPWVGGIVGENNFKFFIQFTAWTTVYCSFALIFMAMFISEVKREGRQVNVNWIVALAFACLFALFSIGMTASSTQFAILNTTTVENLSRTTKVYTLAIYMPRPPNTTHTLPFQTITYPLTSTTTPGTSSHASSTPPRTFAILHTKPGENPWDLGPLGNLKSVLGDHWYDWLLPFKYSPLCNHDRDDSDFSLGPVVERLREEAGITLPRRDDEKSKRRRRRRSSGRGSTHGGDRSRKRKRDGAEAVDETVLEENHESSSNVQPRDDIVH